MVCRFAVGSATDSAASLTTVPSRRLAAGRDRARLLDVPALWLPLRRQQRLRKQWRQRLRQHHRVGPRYIWYECPRLGHCPRMRGARDLRERVVRNHRRANVLYARAFFAPFAGAAALAATSSVAATFAATSGVAATLVATASAAVAVTTTSKPTTSLAAAALATSTTNDTIAVATTSNATTSFVNAGATSIVATTADVSATAISTTAVATSIVATAATDATTAFAAAPLAAAPLASYALATDAVAALAADAPDSTGVTAITRAAATASAVAKAASTIASGSAAAAAAFAASTAQPAAHRTSASTSIAAMVHHRQLLVGTAAAVADATAPTRAATAGCARSESGAVSRIDSHPARYGPSRGDLLHPDQPARCGLVRLAVPGDARSATPGCCSRRPLQGTRHRGGPRTR